MDAQERRQKQQAEVDVNYEVFRAQLPELLGRHAGQFALMKNREVVGVFDTRADAIKAGEMRFGEDVFSAHEITDEIVDLGIYSCV